ncbi:MAG: helix-turn-helix domain-containing protein [Ruminococcus sp.]|nr:helix-turn-helix domain-containing protein [Ruminococcus sp.]
MYRDKLVFIRERNGETQRDVAKNINLEESHYRHCEKEDELFPIKHLNTLCNYFEVSFDYIFNFTETKNYCDYKTDIDTKKMVNRLKEFRKENKLTQEKLAKILNISSGTVAGYEIGRYIIATPFLYTICSKYHISADYLLGKVDNPKYLK